MAGILLRPGEGESLYDGRVVLKSALPELTITESVYTDARPGASPHVHHRHSDTFYVLEGELAFLVGDEEHVLGPGAAVSAPAGVVHGFRSLSPARFLNVHTPDGDFADNLRSLDRGGPGGFDAEPADPGTGADPSSAVLLHAGEGESLLGRHRVATIKVGSEELALIEFELEPAFGGPDPHTHDDHTDAFYVLGGSALFELDGRRVVAQPGTFVAATPGVAHTFTSGPDGARLLNIHAASTGFHERLRATSLPLAASPA